jgi:hypothetical protein
MDSLAAFFMGEANRHRELMVFDWDKAARIIKEKKATTASAGLAGDWEYTGGQILRGGIPVPEDEAYVYLASTWAIPELEVDGETIGCYQMESQTPGWDAKTYWPESSRAILCDNPVAA